MKKINAFCALLLLLITSSSTYAGVTADGITAYRFSEDFRFVFFTDNPSDDTFPPVSFAPFGGGALTGTNCNSGALGTDPPIIWGRVCSGTPGEPIETYTCEVETGPANPSTTTWCLFSENPRIGGKAWAVKFVDGFIPTNDGASFVRCEGVDTFDSVNGCIETLPSQIGIEGGFIKLDTTDGFAPPDRNCSLTAHNGRMVVDDVSNKLYICTASGWKSTLLN